MKKARLGAAYRDPQQEVGEKVGLATLKVYVADGCPNCIALLNDYRRRGVRFVEMNLSRDPDYLEQLKAICWDRQLPVVVDHERISVGFGGQSSSFDELGLDGSSW